jgi:hypothetical protein
MKRKLLLSIFTAVLVVFAFAAQAHATFGLGEFTRVVYDPTTNVEEVTDLGTIGTGAGQINFATASNLVLGGGALAYQLSDFGSGAMYSQLQVAYFAVGGAIPGTDNASAVWVSGGSTAPGTSGRASAGLLSGMLSCISYWSSSSTGGLGVQFIGSMTPGSTYWDVMNKGGGSAVGGLGGFISGNNSNNFGVEITSPGLYGAVEQSIYYFGSPTTRSTGVNIGTVQTVVDGGYTVINPVPLPPSLLLLAPGLLGLFGVRRKMA